MDFTASADPVCLLVDNGSLRPAATFALRRIAGELTSRVGRAVLPVSLLHSDKISPGELEDTPADVFETTVRRHHALGARRFLVLPLFFGPSAALTDYLPERIAAIRDDLGPVEVRLAAPVAGPDPNQPDVRIARILADQVTRTVTARRVSQPVVVMVDHGSPQRAVTAVRDQVARQLADLLREDARSVIAASMERRAGPEFDFNEPLLERALATPPCGPGSGDVMVAPLFFSPGRHAGPAGDIETIARAAEQRCPGLRVHFAPPFGEHPGLIEILADRLREALPA